MKTVCKENLCNGCMACIGKCSTRAIKIVDSVSAFNACIDESLCVNCHQCEKVCPRNDVDIKLKHPSKWYQGWTNVVGDRNRCASGGAATALMKSFINKGGYVASCIFENGNFNYLVTNEISDLKKFAGSKYVKSNPTGVYSKIEKLLCAGEKVLFIGLPCHVAGLKKYVNEIISTHLYTVDIICHGTPSRKVLIRYLEEYFIEIDKVNDIKFRVGNDFRLFINFKPLVMSGIADWYMYTFLKKINYTENCYNCQFARIERIGDITIGDSWGAKLDQDERNKGISLLLIQSEKGQELINCSDMHLVDVNLQTAIENNRQLSAPAENTNERVNFFHLLNRGFRFDRIILRIVPKVFIRQKIKSIILKLKNIK